MARVVEGAGVPKWTRLWWLLVFVIGVLVWPASVGATDGIFAARVYEPYPQQYTDETIGVRIGYVDKTPIAGVSVHSVWNYRTVTSFADGVTDAQGYAYLVRNVSDATCGFTVRVDLFAWWDNDWQQLDSQFFTPCWDSSWSQSPSQQPSQPSQLAPNQGPVGGSNGVCPAGYPVKANDNTGIYHQPWQQFYGATNARNCFATAAAAEAAGYRASKV